MKFLKANYEKIILSIVLLGLLGVVGFLPVKVGQLKEQLIVDLGIPQRKALDPSDLSENLKSVGRVSRRLPGDLSEPSPLFGPDQWVKTRLGLARNKGDSALGPKAMKIMSIRPLYFRAEFDKTVGSVEKVRYQFRVTQEATGKSKRPKVRSAELGKKNDVFFLRKITGSTDNPESFVLEMNDSKEMIPVVNGEPFERIDGYETDLLYAPENRKYSKQRKGDSIKFPTGKYKIVVITENEVVFSAEPTGKRVRISYQ
ncbi:MAG TPA: hypothetical protein EYQ50_23250 [Verrucomicrobiales bacterium]|nr:hypothetical protein [Verrucomicrobiales bacterium]